MKMEYPIAVAGGDHRYVEGKIMILDLGGKKHRFLAHDGTLTDARSGRRFGDYGTRQALHYASDPYRKALSERAAAQALVDDTVRRLGIETMRKVIDSAPALQVKARRALTKDPSHDE